MTVNTLKMCTGDAGPEQSLVLFSFIFQFLYIDAPVTDHRKDINSYIKHLSDTDHDHDEVSPSSGADKSHDMNSKMAGEESRSFNGKDSIETKKKCVLLDSDDRTTGEIWASSRDGLSSGFPTRSYSNQLAQLQRLARMLKFRFEQV